jgi:hypothetical protein
MGEDETALLRPWREKRGKIEPEEAPRLRVDAVRIFDMISSNS